MFTLEKFKGGNQKKWQAVRDFSRGSDTEVTYKTPSLPMHKQQAHGKVRRKYSTYKNNPPINLPSNKCTKMCTTYVKNSIKAGREVKHFKCKESCAAYVPI